MPTTSAFQKKINEYFMHLFNYCISYNIFKTLKKIETQMKLKLNLSYIFNKDDKS